MRRSCGKHTNGECCDLVQRGASLGVGMSCPGPSQALAKPLPSLSSIFTSLGPARFSLSGILLLSPPASPHLSSLFLPALPPLPPLLPRKPSRRWRPSCPRQAGRRGGTGSPQSGGEGPSLRRCETEEEEEQQGYRTPSEPSARFGRSAGRSCKPFEVLVLLLPRPLLPSVRLGKRSSEAGLQIARCTPLLGGAQEKHSAGENILQKWCGLALALDAWKGFKGCKAELKK